MKDIDKKILQILQENGEISMEDLGSKVNLSPSPCYRRVKNLKDAGFIDRNVAVLNKHTPQIVECHRLMGEVDYLLKVRLKNSESYNEFYFNLINKIDFASISGFPSLEELKETTILPLDYV